MSSETMVTRPSADLLRRRAHNLNVLAFALLATPLVVGALSSAWWVEAMRQPTRGQLVVMVWVGAVTAVAAAGGIAAAVGGVVLHAIADSQDAGHRAADAAA